MCHPVSRNNKKRGAASGRGYFLPIFLLFISLVIGGWGNFKAVQSCCHSSNQPRYFLSTKRVVLPWLFQSSPPPPHVHYTAKTIISHDYLRWRCAFSLHNENAEAFFLSNMPKHACVRVTPHQNHERNTVVKLY